MLICCVYAFSLHQGSPDLILGDKPLTSEVDLSQFSARPACEPKEKPGFELVHYVRKTQPICARTNRDA
jgi:hypothetical protein